MYVERKPPFFSRCSMGNGKWYWVVKPGWLEDPIHEGYAASPEEALTQAQRAVGQDLDQIDAKFATYHRQVLAARKRMNSASNGTTTVKMDYIYECRPKFFIQ